MLRDIYVCCAVDQALPDWQNFQADKFAAWRAEHRYVPPPRLRIGFRSTRFTRDDGQHTVGLIVFIIDYQPEGVRL